MPSPSLALTLAMCLVQKAPGDAEWRTPPRTISARAAEAAAYSGMGAKTLAKLPEEMRALAIRHSLSHNGTNHYSRRCPGARVIDLPATTVLKRQRCAAGAHVVFVSYSPMGSSVMRGELPRSVLQQTFASHGVRATLCGPPCNATRLAEHFAEHGDASACVLIKYADPPTQRFCRARGALVVLDNVDNHRAYMKDHLREEGYWSADAIAVQTYSHADWLARHFGLRSIVLPHPHGNLNGWGIPHSNVRPRPQNIGFLVGDAWRNSPRKEEGEALSAVICALNLTLTYVYSAPMRRILARRYPCPNVTHSAYLLRTTYGREARERRGRARGDAGERPAWLRMEEPRSLLREFERSARLSCESSDGLARQQRAAQLCQRGRDHHPDGGAVAVAGMENANHAALRAGFIDHTSQRIHYEVSGLHSAGSAVDIGLLWLPGNQHGTKHAVINRPPTRMEWWWSHGVPTFGWPMNSYVEGARRVGYPQELLNLSRILDLPDALCELQLRSTRACLREVALRGARLTSPQYSAHELLVALCELAEACAPAGILAGHQHQG
jgi:hypothetical protein